MGNISTTNTNTIYKYTAELRTNFDNDKNPVVIDQIRFKSIAIDYNYDKYNFPLIYCTVSIKREDAIKLADNQKNGTVIFTLWKQKEVNFASIATSTAESNGQASIDFKEIVIQEECIYFTPTDISKLSDSIIVDDDKPEDRGYNTTIGLIALKHTNANNAVKHGVISEGTMSSILYYELSDHNLLMEPLQHNASLKNLMLPPLNSLSKTIGYLNNYSAFYDTMYKFFIDFNITYLISSSGKGVKKKGDKKNLIQFVIYKDYHEESMEGMKEKEDLYEIPLSSSYCVLDDGTNSDKFFSGLEGITTKGKSEDKETGLRDKESKLIKYSKSVRLPNNNTTLLNNLVSDAANSAVMITISKNKIDSGLITPNREYNIECTDVYGESYSGTYLLANKKEVYFPEGKGFAMTVIAQLKKLAQ